MMSTVDLRKIMHPIHADARPECIRNIINIMSAWPDDTSGVTLPPLPNTQNASDIKSHIVQCLIILGANGDEATLEGWKATHEYNHLVTVFTVMLTKMEMDLRIHCSQWENTLWNIYNRTRLLSNSSASNFARTIGLETIPVDETQKLFINTRMLIQNLAITAKIIPEFKKRVCGFRRNFNSLSGSEEDQLAGQLLLGEEGSSRMMLPTRNPEEDTFIARCATVEKSADDNDVLKVHYNLWNEIKSDPQWVQVKSDHPDFIKYLAAVLAYSRINNKQGVSFEQFVKLVDVTNKNLGALVDTWTSDTTREMLQKFSNPKTYNDNAVRATWEAWRLVQFCQSPRYTFDLLPTERNYNATVRQILSTFSNLIQAKFGAS